MWVKKINCIAEIWLLTRFYNDYVCCDTTFVADCGRSLLRSAADRLASYHAATICLATRVSTLLVRVCGTVCHWTYDETLATDYLSEKWKHFCSGVNLLRPTVPVSCFVRFRNILTYLFTTLMQSKLVKYMFACQSLQPIPSQRRGAMLEFHKLCRIAPSSKVHKTGSMSVTGHELTATASSTTDKFSASWLWLGCSSFKKWCF